MNARDDERVKEALWEMAARYPGAKFGDANHAAYIEDIGNLPSDAVLWALERAPSESPQWMPNSPMIAVMARRQATLLKSKHAQRSFDQMAKEEKRPLSQEQALQEFYSKCDEYLSHNLGNEITEDNRHMFFQALALLAKVFGLASSAVMGDSEAESKIDRQGMARGYIYSWKQQGFDPYQAMKGLRAAPSTFHKFPTDGMLVALMKGEPMGGFAFGWVRPEAGGATEPNAEPEIAGPERRRRVDDTAAVERSGQPATKEYADRAIAETAVDIREPGSDDDVDEDPEPWGGDHLPDAAPEAAPAAGDAECPV